MDDQELSGEWMSIVKPSSLPSSEDTLFSSQEDWWNNACLNWCRSGWSLYATGYKDAADLLVKHVEERSRDQDTLVYPIIFLYRQYLELAIKELIRDAGKLQDIKEDFPKHHRISDLWSICHDLLTQIFPEDSPNELKEIGRLLAEFSLIDPTSMAFRYPEDREGKPSLPGVSNINLRNVREVINKIHCILFGASAKTLEYLSYKQEMENGF